MSGCSARNRKASKNFLGSHKYRVCRLSVYVHFSEPVSIRFDIDEYRREYPGETG